MTPEGQKRQTQIIPGILENNWEAIERKLELVKPFARTIHIDILDGKFANNTTFLDPEPFRKYSGEFFFELHMMVDDPRSYLQPFAAAGFRRFLGHVERMPDVPGFVAQARQLGEVGLALDRDTPVEGLCVPYDQLDAVLIMTIKAGWSGQQFIEALLDKVRAVRAASQVPIEVDGGVKPETLPLALAAGATRFITTSALFGSPDLPQRYHALCGLAGCAAAE